jgi:hypothetical protein
MKKDRCFARQIIGGHGSIFIVDLLTLRYRMAILDLCECKLGRSRVSLVANPIETTTYLRAEGNFPFEVFALADDITLRDLLI